MKRLLRLRFVSFNRFSLVVAMLLLVTSTNAQVQLLESVKVTDSVMYFDGNKVDLNTTTNSTTGYDYVYGTALTPHGDCIKAFKQYVFLTWYRGGKLDRHVMLSRYNTETGVLKTIEFPHQHTGYNGKWWIGETHNTISVGICPKDSTIHMLYDMHRNGNVTIDNIGTEDYLRYSFSEKGAAAVADDDFTIDRFVNSSAGNYKHLSFDGIDNLTVTKLLTYPDFFINDEGDLFMKNRFGYSENGRFLFAKYDGEKWEGYTDFNRSNASNYGSEYNWGLYGEIKYLNGKIRIGFQRRSNDGNDKFLYQNGIYYAYSDDPSGLTQWKDYTGQVFSRPLADADLIKVMEPGDWVTTTQKDKVYIVGGFDFTITDNEDVHFVSQVKDNENNVTKKLHTYKKSSDTDFTTVEYNAGSELYAAGNDVFVIGLSGGRVNIVKTEGGTSNFQQVYQNTTGPTFDKGVVNVYDGKLYYYLKEAGGSGDKRTTYLQIFDLDVDLTPADTSRYLSFANLTNGQEIVSGSNLTVEANVGSAFKEVSLWAGDVNLGTLTAAPYEWSSHAILTNMTDEFYTFKLIAKDSADVSMEKTVTVFTPIIETLSDKSSLHISFEDEMIANWETDGVDYGVVPAIVDGTNTRAGSKVIALEYQGSTSGHHVQNVRDRIVVPNNHYFHMIAYTATNDIAAGYSFPTAKLGDWAPTPSFTAHAVVNTFERKITSRQNTKGDSLNCYPRLRTKAQGTACVVYYDDIVLYASESATADIVVPTAAHNLTLDNNKLSWTEGIDTLTGVQATLVLRTSNATAEDPVLYAQAAYSTADDATSISVLGDWSVIASLPSGTTTYTDGTATANDRYAVVHRDLAYNYSAPVIYGEESSAVNEQLQLSFRCVGVNGGVDFYNLPVGSELAIYQLNGVKVLAQSVTVSAFSVLLSAGMYIVQVGNETTKVVVR